MRLLALSATLLLLVPGVAGGSLIRSFRTPSHNIGCVYTSGLGGGASLRCDIRSGLKPRPSKPHGCDLDWGDSYELPAKGRAALSCHGDTAILSDAPILRYGKTWTQGSFVCTSRLSGLRCRNAKGHGFFLSRGHSYRF